MYNEYIHSIFHLITPHMLDGNSLYTADPESH
jgi:hypothetical protein